MNRLLGVGPLFRHISVSSRSNPNAICFKTNYGLNNQVASCSYSYSAISTNVRHQSRKNNYRRRNSKGDEQPKFGRTPTFLLCTAGGGVAHFFRWFYEVGKDELGVSEKPLIHETPVESEIKKSWVFRKNGMYEDASNALHEGIKLATGEKDEVAITRCYQELANLYLELEDLKRAEELYKVCLGRYVGMHLAELTETAKFKSKPVISISLRLSQVYVKMKEYEKAEVGFQLCLDRQAEVVQDELKSKDTNLRSGVEVHNLSQTERDAIALYGMILEAYAHYLLTQKARNKDGVEIEEAEVTMIRCQNLLGDLFGQYHSHTITVLNNFAMDCLTHGRLKAAVKFMREVVRKAVMNADIVHLLPGYYCNYAEALYHNGDKDEALEKARTALKLAQEVKDETLIEHCKLMLSELEIETGKKKRGWLG